MSIHELYGKCLSVTVMPKRRYRNQRVDERPASFGYFTIKELIYILNDIQRFPFRDVHYYLFRGRRFRIRVVENEEDKPDSDEPQGPYTGTIG